MKLVCTIGTQGFSDGRRIHRGDVYEVDDDTASTALAAGYATKYVEPVVEKPEVVETPAVVAEPEVVKATDAPVKQKKVTKRSGGR